MKSIFIFAILISVMTVSCKKDYHKPLKDTVNGPAAGNPDGNYPVPAEAQAEDISVPTTVVGDGTPKSCDCESFVEAVTKGGVITFNCGSEPHTIVMDETAKVVNSANPVVIIDGGGLITLSGKGKHRILYMNTCDEDQNWTTSHCDNQDHPSLTVQNITFADGNSTAEKDYDGGGAIWVRGGRFKAVNCRFFNNVCPDKGPDVGGGAIRIFDQYNDLPVYITNCTFGGAEGYGNYGSNGGALSSIGVSWTIYNSLFTHNSAIGEGGNPKQKGTPGGGSGGAIYNDGNTMTLSLYGCKIQNNSVIQHGSSIFFVTNDHSGNIHIEDCTISSNTGGSWYAVYPSISMHDDTQVTVVNSVIE
ncbi:MAG: hypothetical protein IPH24_07595 [Crocinitomicaceae bacterium]|nr:hypothetical protein [Crocinitomicaceae bacterium]